MNVTKQDLDYAVKVNKLFYNFITDNFIKDDAPYKNECSGQTLTAIVSALVGQLDNVLHMFEDDEPRRVTLDILSGKIKINSDSLH